MKIFKKLLACILAVIMTTGIFAACGQKPAENQNGDTEPAPTDDPAKAVEAVVIAYYDAANDFDIDEALEYVAKNSDRYDEMKETFDFEKKAESMLSYLSLSENYTDKIAALCEDISKTGNAILEYEIKKTEVDEDGKSAEVTVEVITPDENEINTSLSVDAFKTKFEELNDGKSYESLLSATNSGNVSKDAYYEYVYEAWEAVFEDTIDEIPDMDTEEKEMTIELELIDDEWKIISVED